MARITLVSRNFPPMTGGMEHLAYELYRGLRRNHDVAMIGPAGCEDYVDSACMVRATTTSPTSVFLMLSLLKGIFLRHPGGRSDVFIGGSGLVAPVALVLAKLSGGKAILLLHGLDIIADSRIYQRFFVPMFRRADLLVCNSRNTARLALDKGVDEGRVAIIHPGVAVDGRARSRDTAKNAQGLAGKTVLLSVGRLIPRKGLAEFITNTLVEMAAEDSEIVFVIAGSEPKRALNRSVEPVLANIRTAISTCGLDAQVRLLGHVADDVVADLYAAADVFVFPLVETPGDVEGFGMVAIEAAAAGTPTVAFDCGGVADAVADGVNGYLVPAGDYARFGSAVRQAIATDFGETCRTFAGKFSWQNYAAKMEACIAKVLAV